MEREKTVRLFMAGSGGGNGRTRARAHDATPKGPPIFPAQTSFGHPSGGEGDTHSKKRTLLTAAFAALALSAA